MKNPFLYPVAGAFALAFVSLSAAHAGPAAGALPAATVAGVRLPPLPPHRARAYLARKLGGRLETRIVLTDGSKTVRQTRRSMGVHLDTEAMAAMVKEGRRSVPLRLRVDEAEARRAFAALAPAFAFKGRNARVIDTGKAVHVAPSLDSRRLDVGKSAVEFVVAVDKRAALRTFRVAVKKSPPRLTTEKLKGIDGRLGRMVTHFNVAREKRTKNLRLGVRRINGTVITAGGVFSLNDTVGPRTQDRGFRTAIIFKHGTLVEDIGGGISQVTGTLFNAALLAGLPIVEYRTHSRPVSYLPIGRDATVAWGGFDMKFKNNTPAPVYISYKIAGNAAIATLYGHKTPGQTVRLSVHSVRLGPRRISAALYRVIKRHGALVAKERIGRSEYKWKPGGSF